MATQNFQKKSPRASAKSKQDTTAAPDPAPAGSAQTSTEPYRAEEPDRSPDRAADQVARIRAAKDAARRATESFGDASEYDVTLLQGQLKREPALGVQSSLGFDNTEAEAGEQA